MTKIKPIKAKAGGNGGDFEIAPEGVYLARCYKMVDVGTQTSTGAFGTKESRTVYLYWELLQDDDGEVVRMDNGEPYSIFNSYTLSMNQKANLRKHIDSWRGKPLTEEQAEEFDITVLLDKFCKLQIVHRPSKDGSRTYANIGAIMTTKKKIEGVNEVSAFSIEDPDMEVFNDLPEWLQNKIEEAPEWDEVTTPEQTDAKPSKPADNDDEDDKQIDIADVPF